MGKEEELRTNSYLRRAARILPLPASLALALSCGVSVEPGGVQPIEPLHTVDINCFRKPVLPGETRQTLKRQARVIEQILENSFRPNVKEGIRSGNLQLILGVANGTLSEETVSYFDELLCLGFWQSVQSPNNPNKFTYKFPSATFAPNDFMLKEVFEENVIGELLVAVEYGGARNGNFTIQEFEADMLPQPIVRRVSQDKLRDFAYLTLRIPQSGIIDEKFGDAVYSTPDGNYEFMRRWIGEAYSGKRRLMLHVDESGRFGVHVKMQ